MMEPNTKSSSSSDSDEEAIQAGDENTATGIAD
jgi:hypothetical protein